jgi:quinol monooxygenase YgiN
MGEMRALPGKEAQLHAFIARVIVPALQTTDGCRGCHVWQADGEPGRFLIIEEWDSVAAHQASVKQIDPDDIKAIMELLDDSPAGHYYRVYDPAA